MPRETLDAVLDRVIGRVVARVVPVIARAIAEKTAAHLREQLTTRTKLRSRKTRGHRPQRELTRWSADRRARRVPTFVIEATGLDTKKKIVAKFGENAAFVKGKPLPRKAAA